MPQSQDSARCPTCHGPGRKVEAQTLAARLVAGARARVLSFVQYRFCKDPTCDTVYFAEGSMATFSQADVRVPVFQKSSDPARPLCYCFGHSVADIAHDVAESGTSPALAEITEKCRQGLGRCETENPQGSCCLGNVRQVIKEALAASAEHGRGSTISEDSAGDVSDCCAAKAKRPE